MSDEKDSMVPKLTSSNWQEWRISIKGYLQAKALWGFVADTELLPEERRQRQRALGYIIIGCDMNSKFLIADCDEPRQAWEILKARFEATSGESKSLVSAQFDAIRWVPGTDMSAFCAKIRAIWQKMKAIGIDQSEEAVVFRMIHLLPREYEYSVRPSSMPKAGQLDWAITQLLTDEESRKARRVLTGTHTETATFTEKVLTTTLKKPGHKPTEYRRKVICWTCGEPGHVKRNCPKQSSSQNKLATAKQSFCWTTCDSDNWGGANIWIDSGATRHMFANRDLLFECKKLDIPEKLFLGNEKALKASTSALLEYSLKLRTRCMRSCSKMCSLSQS